MRDKNGQIALFIVFVFIGIIIILIGAVVAPMGANLASHAFVAGEDIIRQNNDTINNIQNATIRASLNDINDAALDNQETNIETATALYQYAWVFLLVVAGFFFFLLTRQTVELGGGGIF